MLTTIHTSIETFLVGDVVKLKAGGPRMTVTRVDLIEDIEHLCCEWFDGHGELRQQMFGQNEVIHEPRYMSPGSVCLRQYGAAVCSSI